MTIHAQSNSLETRPGEERLRGVVERIVFFNEENHFCICEFRPEERGRRGNGHVSLTGNLPGVQCGETLDVVGTWTRHPTHGLQFRATRFQSALPATLYGIRKYLGSGLVPGIGKTYAEKIVATFGTSTFQVISEDSARLQEVPGIGKKRALEIKRAWDEQRSLREVLTFLQTYGISVGQCLKLVKTYGAGTQEKLQSDPYIIAREIHGIGFKTADRIAINLGFANESPQRLDSGLLFAMRELESEGHTAVEANHLQAKTAELLDVEPSLLENRMHALIDSRHLRIPPGSTLIQLPVTERAEQAISEAIARLRGTPGSLPPIQIEKAIVWAQERAGFQFAPEQAEALRACLTAKLSILTGGPGTGKTSILRALVEILRAKKARVRLASPTGRAAQRMTETTGQTAQTIHRLLQFDPVTGGFTADEDAPLKCDYMIVDEASMLDSRLTAALFRALPASTSLLLVGDVHQLPSVGAGNVLHDLIATDAFSITRLQRIFRQRKKSLILSTAYAILEGDTAPPGTIRDLAELRKESDFHFIARTDPESCLATVIALCRDWIPRITAFDAIRDVQVIAPMHKGIAGIANLNRSLQDSLNPGRPALQTAGASYRVGDKIIQLVNNYETGIFNGDLGRVLRIDADNVRMTAEFDDREIDFERAALSEIQPAYAISIHKSQGSEFPAVVIPLLKQHFMLLQRNLLYTAVTRGRRYVFIVGDPTAYAMAVRNRVSSERCTDLQRKILAQ